MNYLLTHWFLEKVTVISNNIFLKDIYVINIMTISEENTLKSFPCEATQKDPALNN